MAFCDCLKPFVVVGVPAAAGVLDISNGGKLVAHLMQKRRTDFFYGTVQRHGADIDFIAAFLSGLPYLIYCEMPVCADCLFQADDGLR